MDELVFQKCGKSVLRLHFKSDFRGTGFAIYAKGHECLIKTCHHALADVPDEETVTAYFSGSHEPFECEFLFRDLEADITLLQVRPSDMLFDAVTPLEFLEIPGAVAPTMKVVLLAFYSLEGLPMYEPGTSEGEIIAHPEYEKIIYSSSSRAGTSGAPVITCMAGEECRVVGVHVRSSLGTSYATPVGPIREFLLAWSKLENVDEDTSINTMLKYGPRI